MDIPQHEIDECIIAILEEKDRTKKRLLIYLMCKELLDEDYHNQNGAILYSTHDTIKRGNFFIIGYNPGGNPDSEKLNNKNHQILPHLLNQLQDDAKNEYLSKDWDNKQIPNNLEFLFTELDYPLDQVCATNLIFKRSTDESGVHYSEAKKCWGVNKLFFDIVQPRVIIANGNDETKSTYKFLRHHLWTDNISKETQENAEHGGYLIKYFNYANPDWDHETLVVGLPHLSRYTLYSTPTVSKRIIDQIAKYN